VHRLPILALAVLLAAAFAACGRDRQGSRELRFEPSERTVVASYPRAGMSFRRPANMLFQDTAPPGVFRGFTSDGFLAGFAYRRAEQLPRSRRELETARRRLERASRRRSSSFRLLRSRSTRVAGAPAVELVGDQEISSGRLRTRSVHVFKGSAEYVLELAVPVGEFERLDSAIFPLVRDTLKVSGRVRRGR
jgi:hypothetical protein